MRLVPAVASLYFLIAGTLLIPLPGWQNDELFFAGPLYDNTAAVYYAHIGSAQIPLMVASYTGALKTWLYAAIFNLVQPSSWSIRLPMLLMGVLTLWLTWRWMLQIGAGARAAAIAVALLATDASFLMTSTFDWGPVALQHVFLMGGLVALQTWIGRPSRRWLALAFFLWGLGLWDKALMIWSLSGLALACAAVYPRELLRRIKPAALAIAAASFLIGAAPFVWYNIARPGDTVSRNVNLSPDELPMKVTAVRKSLDGSALFGYIVARADAGGHRDPATAIEHISVAVRNHFGSHESDWMPIGFGLAALCALLAWRSPERRLLLFLFITMAVSWLEMIFNRGTGTFVHHDVLLWPFPFVFTAIAFTAAARPLKSYAVPALAVATGVLVLGNILTVNEYFADLVTNGGTGGWTDAIDNLPKAIDDLHAPWVGLLDWGCVNDLRTIYRGKQGLFDANEFAKTPLSPADAEEIQKMAAVPGLVLVEHVSDKQMIPQINERFRKAIESQGLTEHVRRIVPDHEGRPVFEVFSLR